MKWRKKGLIYAPDGSLDWAKHSALQPTPLLQGEKIRVFVGLRDHQGRGRVGFVDLSAENPSEVLATSAKPALDLGKPGAFDENGVVPCQILERDQKLYLYYAGYQQGTDVRFRVFSGLALSHDGGESFERYSDEPLLAHTPQELLFRVIHSIAQENGHWRVWYGAGSAFLNSGSKTLPQYNIRTMTSKDGISFPESGDVCVETRDAEYRVGRPYVIKHKEKYLMFYAYATPDQTYRLGLAISENGRDWQRHDDKIGLDVSSQGWDSQMISYPSLISFKDKTYLFYNGNHYGETGFGYAELESWDL